MNIFVDLDDTLAEYTPGMNIFKIGKPIPKVVDKVKQWLLEGHTITIFTARLSLFMEETRTGFIKLRGYHYLVNEIDEWCKKHIGQEFEITCVKWHIVDVFIDDKCRGLDYE